MRASIAVGLKMLSSKIHHHPPLDPQESRKLLKLLTASFRSKLAEEYSGSASGKPSATDAHFASLFASPLLLNQSNSNSQSKNVIDVISSLQAIVERPMERFREQIGTGTATLETAKESLSAHMDNLAAIPRHEMKTLMKSSLAATTILNWLWSSGQEESLRFASDRKFISLLMPFVVAEKQERRIEHWLSRMQSKAWETLEEKRSKLRIQGYMRKQLVSSTIRYGQGLRHALEKFANDLKSAAGINATRRLTLGSTGHLLANKATKADRPSDLTAWSYDTLMDLSHVWSVRADYDKARLAVFHPLSPNPFPALQYLRMRRGRDIEEYTPATRLSILCFCIDTTQLLLSTNCLKDADWVLRFIKMHFLRETAHQQTELSSRNSLASGTCRLAVDLWAELQRINNVFRPAALLLNEDLSK